MPCGSKVRKALWEAYGWFVAAYREAAEKLRAGDRTVEFPPGSFPPRLPFVEAEAATAVSAVDQAGRRPPG